MVALAAVAAALPAKPTKTSPKKKYDPAVHGLKDTYTTYQLTPDVDLEVPAPSPYLDALLPPSTYDNTYFEGPMVSILPPEGSSYIGLTGDEEGLELMSPPPADTYSSYDDVVLGKMVPPPVDAPVVDSSSYLSHTGEGEEAMEVPELSSYAHMGHHASSGGHEVLSSLAAMARALPHLSSYTHYGPQEQDEVVPETPIPYLVPPSVHSSYSEALTSVPELTDAQISAAQEAEIKIPSLFLEPPAP